MKNIQLLELQNLPKTQTNSNSLATLTDKDLLALCRKYGAQAILWKRKFIGLLPEVDRRELYLKKRCSSIYEFAAKFGGVTESQVKRVISIDKKLSELELFELREKLINGEVSLNKLARIVSVANKGNEKILMDAMKKLSQDSLETFVKDEKNRQMAELLGANDSAVADGDAQLRGTKNPCEGIFVRTHKQDYEMNGVVAQVGRMDDKGCIGAKGNGISEVKMQDQGVALKKLRLNLSEETLEELLELQGKGINIDTLLKEFLQKREESIAEGKAESVKKVTGREEKRRSEGKKPVRQISVKVKRILKEEYGTKCAVNGCDKAAEHLHHTVPFSINGSNSPDLLRPLCRAHHDIVHSVNAAYVEKKGMG